MARRIGQPVTAQVWPAGQPVTFTWRGMAYRVRVISHWRLATRWWDTGREADRHYYRVITSDLQVFELYCDAAHGNGWVLDVCQD